MTRLIRYRHEWPEADRTLWETLFHKGGFLEPSGALAHVRSSTAKNHEVNYGLWLGWLERAEPAALCEPPVARITPRRIQAWMDTLAHNAPYTRLMRLDAVLRIISATAPGTDLRTIRRIRELRYADARESYGSRKDGRILSSAVLLQAGLALAEEAAGAATEPERARLQRDGTMIVLLALLPMRIRSFTELALGSSVLVSEREVRISLTAAMTKTGSPWEAPVPEPTAQLLRDYISVSRPVLAAQDVKLHDALWLSDHGRPYVTSYLSRRIGDITTRLVGVRVPPHFFRDALVTTLRRESPDAARLTRPLLGHAGFRMADEHYDQARSLDATRRYASVLSGLMSDGPNAQRR